MKLKKNQINFKFWFILFLCFFILGKGTVFSCSPELSIITVFQDFDLNFSDIVSNIDRLIRIKALQINLGQKVIFEKEYSIELEHYIKRFKREYNLDNPPDMIYDSQLWNGYYYEFNTLSQKLLNSLSSNLYPEFHETVDKIEDLFLKMYKVRGKKDFRIVYPVLKKYRKNVNDITMDLFDSLLFKLDKTLSIMISKNDNEAKIKSKILELRKVINVFSKNFFKAAGAISDKEKIILTEIFFNDILRIENSILNLKWFLKK
jgi:hypothetical protein